MFDRITNRLLSPGFSLFVIGLMMSLPFIYPRHTLPISSFYGEWLAGTLGLLALLPLLKRNSWQPLEIPQIALVFLGFIALVFIQWSLGMLNSSQYALMAASYLIWAFFLAVLGSHLRRQLGWERLVTVLAWFVLVSGLLNGIFVLLQLIMQNGVAMSFMPKLSGYGAIAQRNHFANHTALALASLFFLYARGHLKLLAALPATLAFLFMFSLSGSRSTWLYLLAFVILALLLRAMVVGQQGLRAQVEQSQSRRLLRMALIALPLFVLVQLAVFFLFNQTGLEKVTSLPAERLLDESVAISGLTIRLHLWQESWQLFMQSPWLGIGLGQIRWETFNTFNQSLAAGMPATFEHAHNLFIHIMTELGVAGLVLLLTGVVAWLRGFSWKHLSFSSWWLLAMLGVIFIHSMLEYPLWYAYFLGMAAFLLGAGEEKTSQVRIAFSGRALVVTILVLGTVHLGSTLAGNQIIKHWMYVGLKDGVQPEYQEAMFNDLHWVQNKTLFAPYVLVLYAHLLTPDETDLQEKLAITRASLNYMPTRAAAYRYPLLLALNGEREEAVLQLRNALAVFKGSFTKQVKDLPFQYWQLYIELLQEAKPKLNILEKLPTPEAGDPAAQDEQADGGQESAAQAAAVDGAATNEAITNETATNKAVTNKAEESSSGNAIGDSGANLGSKTTEN
jgi:O-antigen ligase